VSASMLIQHDTMPLSKSRTMKAGAVVASHAHRMSVVSAVWGMLSFSQALRGVCRLQ